MVKSHRPSELFHWSHPVPLPITDLPPQIPPGSPSILDPFSPPIPLHDPTPIPRNLSRPPSLFSPSTTSLVSGTATTPRIILASPSTSTIHYLFPSSDTKSNKLDSISISSQGTSPSSTSTPSLSRSSSTSRSSCSVRSNGGISVENRIIHDTFPLPPTRSGTLGRNKGVLTPSKRVISTSKDREVEKSWEIERGREKVKKEDISGPLGGGAGGLTGSLSMRTLRRQPSMADLTRGGSVRGEQMIRVENRLGIENMTRAKEKPEGVRRKDGVILRDIENRRERRGWEIGSRVCAPLNMADDSLGTRWSL